MAVTYKISVPLLLFYFIVFVFSSKLNVPRVLLPYKTSISTNYTLEVTDGGCYRWSSSRPEVATITPISDGDLDIECAKKAVVSAVSTSASRQSTIILASDEASDTVLKCDVIVDAIHSVEIVTTTRELFLDDAPEAFEVIAKNDQEDTFTNIDGIAFDWKLESKRSTTSSVLRFLTFEASPYETPPSIYQWEREGLKGSIVLVEGIGTGVASVSVQLQDLRYKHVPAVTVTLIVVANLMLNPAHDVYILPECKVHYKVELIKQGRPHEIKMPSDQYYLEIKNDNIVLLDSKNSHVSGLSIGSTQIVLHDKHTADLEAFRQPTAGIHVVTAHHLGFDVRPGHNWVLQTATVYEITIRLFDIDNHEIHPSDNIRLDVKFQEKYFKVLSSSKNGTYHVVSTKILGKTKINAKLTSVVSKDGTAIPVGDLVENDQPVEIYDKISVLPKQLAYPWDPISKQSYSGRPVALGGSGSYSWKSSNTSVFQIKKDGTFVTQGPGVAQLTVYDANNKWNYDTLKISVIEVGDLEVLPGAIETIVDQKIYIPLAFYGFRDTDKKNKITFEDCTKLKLDVEFVDRRYFVYDEDIETAPYPGACRTLTFTAKYQGYSRVYVSYGKLKTSFVIAGFKTLLPLSPPSVAILALGTSREVAFEGGPRAWVLKEDTHFINLDIAKKSIVNTELIRDPYRYNVDLHVFSLSCGQLGETEMTLSVGNEPSATNTMPASQQAILRASCDVPKKIKLKLITKECKSKKATCPMSQDVTKVPIQNNEDIQIEASIIDSHGRKFQNVSTLEFQWTVSDSTLGKLSDEASILSEINAAKGFRKPVRYYQDFHPFGKEGLVTLSVKINGYKKELLQNLGITVTNDMKPLSASIDIELVKKLEVNPEKVSVFNHPDNKVLINVRKGSGHFLIEPNNVKLADVTYNEDISSIEIVPKNNGLLSLSVYDMCACIHVNVDVKISTVHSIEVEMPDKVELGKDILADVRVLDEEGLALSLAVFSLINLQSLTGSSIVNIKLQANKENVATFIVHSVSLGHTTVTFQAISKDKVILSPKLSVQVFPPFKLHPRNITLLRGSKFQVESSGGPEPQLNINFGVRDGNITVVSNAGIITATKLGSSKIVGHVLSGNTADQTIYSQDEVEVHVVDLNGIKLHVPLTRVKTDTELPAYLVGLNDQEIPFSYVTSDPSLIVTWSVTNTDTVDLLPVYHKVAIYSSEVNNFAIRLFTKHQGEVTLKVEVFYNGRKYTDEIQLHVFEELRMKIPDDRIGLSMLMAPNTVTQIKTNRDGMARMNYKLESSTVTGIVNVDARTGKLVSSPNTGEATIIITANENFGINQKIVLLVKVKRVGFMMISAETSVKTEPDRPLTVVPIGMNILFTVAFFDNIGNKFSAVNANVKYRLSRFDLLHVSRGSDNATFIVHAFKEGNVVIKVWDENDPRIADYVKVEIGNVISPPTSELTVGDVLCLSCHLLSDDGHKGFWYTAGDSHVVSLVHNGLLVARDVGISTVHYNVSSSLVTSTKVVVKPISRLTFDSRQTKFISNPSNGQTFNVGVFLDGNDHTQTPQDCSRIFSSMDTDYRIHPPFVCDISFNDNKSGIEAREILSVTATYNRENGCYQCRIQSIPSLSSALKQQTSTYLSDLVITARIDARNQQPSIAESIEIPFLPQFYVQIDEITLSNLHDVVNVAVSVAQNLTDQLIVTASDSNLIEILPVKTDVKDKHSLLFPVRLHDVSVLWESETFRRDHYVKISCSSNKQVVEVPVKLKLFGQHDASNCVRPLSFPIANCVRPSSQNEAGWSRLFHTVYDNYQNWLITTLSLLGIAAALFIGYRAVLGQNQNMAFRQTSPILQPIDRGNGSFYPHGYGPSWSHIQSPTSSPKPHLYSVDDPSPNRTRFSPPPYRRSPYGTSFHR